MPNHPKGPFSIRIDSYSLEANYVGTGRTNVYTSRHRSPYTSARRLASIIYGKSVLAKELRQYTFKRGLYMIIESGDRTKRTLKEHLATFPPQPSKEA
jgi:hypothetical protein